MTQLERNDLHAGIETRYPDNNTEAITPKLLRDGLHELVDSVFVTATDTGAVPNVPEYKPGTFYVVGFTVRYTPAGGSEGFYAAKTAGKHTAPGPGNYIDWKVVPGPVTPTALSQELTLSQAQGLDQAGVVAGREYIIDCGLDGNGYQQTVTVRGIANEFYDVEGTLEVAGLRTAITDFKVQAGTWRVKQYASVTPAQLAAVATTLPLTTTRTSDYTLQLADAGCLVPVGSGNAVTVTVPAHADVAFAVGTTLYVAQDGAGLVTIAGAAGVVVQTADGYKLPGQWQDVALHKRDLNTWVLKGGVS